LVKEISWCYFFIDQNVISRVAPSTVELASCQCERWNWHPASVGGGTGILPVWEVELASCQCGRWNWHPASVRGGTGILPVWEVELASCQCGRVWVDVETREN